MNVLGIRLRKARIALGYKQTDVFRKIGLNNKTLSGYENSVSIPDAETVRMLAELYGVSIDWLFARGESGFVSPMEDDFTRFVRYMEEKYDVVLHDDPILVNSLHQLVETVALVKRNSSPVLVGLGI